MNNKQFVESATALAENNILSFWLQLMQDNEHGGFYGRIDGHGNLCADAEKGAVLNARLLWSFAAAYRMLGKQEYLNAATRAYNYIREYFLDKQYGGVYWSLNADGTPLDKKKQSYAIGFMIYGLSEYARATNCSEALDLAVGLFHDLQAHAFDEQNVGYIEALTQDWQPISDMRLSDKDENGEFTMNTHLHILEPYTNLYRVWKDEQLEKQLRILIDIFIHRLLNPITYHLDLFFDRNWRGNRDIESYGHDIEAVWLINEALEVIGDDELTKQVRPVLEKIAIASAKGLQSDGSMIHEAKRVNSQTGKSYLIADMQRQWWVECETVIGFLDQAAVTGNEQYREQAEKTYNYICDNLVDWQGGEWYWAVLADGSLDTENDKAGFWKCPYHNTRMCLEIIQRLS